MPIAYELASDTYYGLGIVTKKLCCKRIPHNCSQLWCIIWVWKRLGRCLGFGWECCGIRWTTSASRCHLVSQFQVGLCHCIIQYWPFDSSFGISGACFIVTFWTSLIRRHIGLHCFLFHIPHTEAHVWYDLQFPLVYDCYDKDLQDWFLFILLSVLILES